METCVVYKGLYNSFTHLMGILSASDFLEKDAMTMKTQLSPRLSYKAKEKTYCRHLVSQSKSKKELLILEHYSTKGFF